MINFYHFQKTKGWLTIKNMNRLQIAKRTYFGKGKRAH